MSKRPKEETHILFVSPAFPMTSESPSLGLVCWALLTFYNHILFPAGKASRLVPLLPFLLRQGHREAQKASSKALPWTLKSQPRCSREQSLVLPTHELYRATGTLARSRENPDQNRQAGGPGKGPLATISLINISVNLYDTLKTS